VCAFKLKIVFAKEYIMAEMKSSKEIGRLLFVRATCQASSSYIAVTDTQPAVHQPFTSQSREFLAF
jgi:hypothetical protein